MTINVDNISLAKLKFSVANLAHINISKRKLDYRFVLVSLLWWSIMSDLSAFLHNQVS